MRSTYTNPVWPGTMADPFVLKAGGAYYAYGTAPPDPHTGRQVRLLRSDDLVAWEDLGGALEPAAEGADVWAPEVAERGGTFFMYHSAGGGEGEGHRLRVAVADRPEGPFRDTGRLFLPDEPFSIDASPFQDPADGRWYLFFAKDYLDVERPGTGTAVVPLSDDMLSPAGESVPVALASADWQVYERDRRWLGRVWPKWHTVEGPFCVERSGRYYCFYSGGLWHGPDYGVGYAVAEHPMGPWTDMSSSGPNVLRGTPIFPGPGHNCVVRGRDGATDYIVYHAWDVAMTSRRMCVDRLEWTLDGPVCDGPSPLPRPVP